MTPQSQAPNRRSLTPRPRLTLLAALLLYGVLVQAQDPPLTPTPQPSVFMIDTGLGYHNFDKDMFMNTADAKGLVDGKNKFSPGGDSQVSELGFYKKTKIKWENAELVVAKLYILKKDIKDGDEEVKVRGLPVMLWPDGNVLTINPAEFHNHTQLIGNGAFIRIDFKAKTPKANDPTTLEEHEKSMVFHIATPGFLIHGGDIGVSMTFIDRWGDHDGAAVSEGLTAYYALTEMKTQSFRAVANLTVLDMVEEKDFELGVGLGFMYKNPGLDPDNNTGFSIIAGVGYNISAPDYSTMRDDTGAVIMDGDQPKQFKVEPFYTFLGLGVNFGKGAK